MTPSARILAGRYRLDTEIGRGAMGTVYRAYDEVLRRPVAIKEVTFPSGMPPAEITEVADRTLREARAIAALSHPHVITLFDILTPESGPVIVMELMVARSLAQVLADSGPLTDTQAAAIGAAVSAGLMAAHAAGITHRDVKPANVLVADDGRIKLTDFGIARSASEQTLTATGMLLGSPAYISPEVASGEPASAAADAWGLGALLFAAVEGRPPFDRGDPITTLTAVVSDPVPAHPRSERLTPIIDGLLIKDRARRMTIDEAHERLAALADGTVFLPAPARADPAMAPESVSDPPQPGAAQPMAEAAPPTGGSSLPPPPWSATAGASLAPLPAKPAGRGAAVMITAVLVALAAAGVGMAWVLVFSRLG